jgi:NAD(P)-dependent dehydrogenase (short-subunit alcohol dehydrogenase family)
MDVVQLDVNDSKSIAAAVKTVSAATNGKLDFLVNNSGAGKSLRVKARLIIRLHHAIS